jgi:signal peptidase II
MTGARRHRGSVAWLWLSLVIVVLDQATKVLVLTRIELYDRIPIVPYLDLTHLHNTGAAFSFLSDAGGWQRWFFVILGLSVSGLVAVWLARLPAGRKLWLSAALALIVGGALGNVIDRLILGYVVDFVLVYYERWHFPAFNVADSAITVGAAILLIESVMARDGRIEPRHRIGR